MPAKQCVPGEAVKEKRVREKLAKEKVEANVVAPVALADGLTQQNCSTSTMPMAMGNLAAPNS